MQFVLDGAYFSYIPWLLFNSNLKKSLFIKQIPASYLYLGKIFRNLFLRIMLIYSVIFAPTSRM